MNTLLRGLLRHVYMDQADAGAASGGTAGAEQAGTGAEGAGTGGDQGQGAEGGQSGSGTESGAGTENVLAGAQSESAQTTQVQEKYLVKNDDGSVNWEQSALKQAEGYNQLSKRMGSSEAPPKAATDYTITVPDALKEAFGVLSTDPLVQQFQKDAHAVGLNQKQFDVVMGAYMNMVPDIAGGVQQLNAADCEADLKKTWTNDADYKAGLGNAHKAATAFFGSDAQDIINTYGNDPRLIRGLAKMGAELGEDTSVNTGDALPAGTSVEELMSSKAYNDASDPNHAKVSAQVKAYYERKAQQDAKSGNAPAFL